MLGPLTEQQLDELILVADSCKASPGLPTDERIEYLELGIALRKLKIRKLVESVIG